METSMKHSCWPLLAVLSGVAQGAENSCGRAACATATGRSGGVTVDLGDVLEGLRDG
jgi:hypothetical protein